MKDETAAAILRNPKNTGSTSAILYRRIGDYLERLGICIGDTVFVHSDMGANAKLVQELGTLPARSEIIGSFHRALADIVGPEGSVAALASDYNYSRLQRPFIVEETPPDPSLGAYPLFLCRQPEHRRSLNPVMSIVALGKSADFICEPISAYGYGSLSPWQRLIDVDAKTVLWGIPPISFTFGHHVEHMVGVPYKYNKLFRTPVYFRNKPIALPVICSLRFLRYRIIYDPLRYAGMMTDEGLLDHVSDGGFEAHVYKNRRFSDWLTLQLAADPYFLLAGPPDFVPGEIPTDDPAITHH